MIVKDAQHVEEVLRKPGVLLGAGLALLVVVAILLVLLFPLYKDLLSDSFWFPIIVMAVILFMILNATAACILAERKIAGFTQDRYGPNRVGFWGLLQPIADGLKFLLKEDIIPAHVDKPLFLLAPSLSLIASLIGFAIIPWAGDVHWPWMAPGTTVSTQVARLDIGVLYFIGVGAVGVYGIVLAGYASNNKYSFYGSMRATAQLISYELPLGLALLGVLLSAGTLRLEDIVAQQARTGVWYVFLQPVPFLLMFICILAETNRAPFDLPEAEQELVGGYHTEYSAMKFAMFFLSEYAHIITGSAVMIALFFGGWHFWGLTDPENTAWWAMLIKLAVYLVKIALDVLLFMVVRWTLPRFRFDQLMRLAWQNLVPVGVAIVVGMAVLTALGWQRTWWATWTVNLLALIAMLWTAARSRRPVTGRQEDLPPCSFAPPWPT
jgi:NADH-quinone oxidoreductase subunit H